LTSALQNIHHYFQPKQPEDLYEYCVKLFRAHNFHSSIKPCKCIANATLGVLLMKTATIPFLRVDPALREAAEKVLRVIGSDTIFHKLITHYPWAFQAIFA
jgi:hypothetical protein